MPRSTWVSNGTHTFIGERGTRDMRLSVLYMSEKDSGASLIDLLGMCRGNPTHEAFNGIHLNDSEKPSGGSG